MKRVLIVIISLLLFCSSCGCVVASSVNNGLPDALGLLEVHYLDVGQGDCIIIKLPDGTCGMIDCGEFDKENQTLISKWLSRVCGDTLEFLVLTHPDSDHVGNAEYVIANYKINKLYIPFIVDDSPYPYFHDALGKVDRSKTKVIISEDTVYKCTDDYILAFLAPKNVGLNGSIYFDFNYSEFDPKYMTNRLSPFIFLECYGVKFLFSGDASAIEEKGVMDYYKLGFYNFKYPRKVDLYDIDFFKVPHHGSDDGCLQSFVLLLSPANAIISVGENNIYGHPSFDTLRRLIEYSNGVNLYRTDFMGTVSVLVDSSGNYKIYTNKK